MYPSLSTYAYAAINLIYFIDANSDSITVSRHIYRWRNGVREFVRTMDDEEFEQFKGDYITQLQTITNDELAYRGDVIVIIHLNNKILV
jgi:hypothetical protein